MSIIPIAKVGLHNKTESIFDSHVKSIQLYETIFDSPFVHQIICIAFNEQK